jgi:hypothetical protein
MCKCKIYCHCYTCTWDWYLVYEISFCFRLDLLLYETSKNLVIFIISFKLILNWESISDVWSTQRWNNYLRIQWGTVIHSEVQYYFLKSGNKNNVHLKKDSDYNYLFSGLVFPLRLSHSLQVIHKNILHSLFSPGHIFIQTLETLIFLKMMKLIVGTTNSKWVYWFVLWVGDNFSRSLLYTHLTVCLSFKFLQSSIMTQFFLPF